MDRATQEAAVKRAEEAIQKILVDLEEETGNPIDDVEIDTIPGPRCSIFMIDDQ